MKSTQISELMVKDHNLIMQNIKDLEDMKERDITYINKLFNDFKWNLEKHFFVEERAVFTFYNPEKVDESYEIFVNLTKQHTDILEEVENIQKKLQKWEPFDFEDLKKLLVSHKTLEENNLYPVLDQEISEGEKRFIIERIEDIRLGERKYDEK